MTCPCNQKSSLAAINIAAQSIAANGVVNFSTNRIYTGISIQHTPGSSTITLTKPGLYLIAFDGDFTIGTTGAVTFKLQNNGVDVPAAESTIQATAAVPVGINFVALIKVEPSCCVVNNAANLQVVGSATGSLANANITVVKQA